MKTRPQYLPVIRESCFFIILIFIQLLAIVQFVHSLIILQPNDWDLDAFLYLGSRLDNGELIYFREFETKLPLLQYIFWLANNLGGIGAWRIITFLVSWFLLIISTYLIVDSLTADYPYRRKISTKIILLASSISLLLLYSLPGSASAQISMFSAVFLYLAIALWHRALKYRCSENFYIVLSGAATAIAVSIRPNYLFALPGFAMFIIIGISGSQNINKYFYATRQAGSFLLGLVFVTLVQFVPYFVFRNGQLVLLSGLLALGHFYLPGISLTKLAIIQFYDRHVILLYLFIYVSAGMLLFVLFNTRGVHNRSHQLCLAGVLTSIVSILGLNYSFMAVHFWEFYSIMFVPYAAVFLTYLCIVLNESNTVPEQLVVTHEYREWIIIAVMLLGSYFVVSQEIPTKCYDLVFNVERRGLFINDRNVDRGLLNILKLSVEKGISFYVPANVNYHRLLRHERIGDGHSWMLYYVLSGKRVGPVDDIFLYSDRVHESPCTALWESGKNLIVVTGKKLEPSVLRCLTAEGSNYEELLVDDPKIGNSFAVSLRNLPGYRFFVYKSVSESVFKLMN